MHSTNLQDVLFSCCSFLRHLSTFDQCEKPIFLAFKKPLVRSGYSRPASTVTRGCRRECTYHQASFWRQMSVVSCKLFFIFFAVSRSLFLFTRTQKVWEIIFFMHNTLKPSNFFLVLFFSHRRVMMNNIKGVLKNAQQFYTYASLERAYDSGECEGRRKKAVSVRLYAI